jgi:hypothetical protein
LACALLIPSSVATATATELFKKSLRCIGSISSPYRSIRLLRHSSRRFLVSDMAL